MQIYCILLGVKLKDYSVTSVSKLAAYIDKVFEQADEVYLQRLEKLIAFIRDLKIENASASETSFASRYPKLLVFNFVKKQKDDFVRAVDHGFAGGSSESAPVQSLKSESSNLTPFSRTPLS